MEKVQGTGMNGTNLEHRLSQRVPGHLELLVYRSGMPVATGKIRDASGHGFFIVTDYTDVELHQNLDIEIRLQEASERPFRRIRAEVARISEEGLGVEIESTPAEDAAISSVLARFRKHERLRPG